jgi:hypothetical protein
MRWQLSTKRFVSEAKELVETLALNFLKGVEDLGVSFVHENKDDIESAINGLDIFTKNYCMNCAETDRLGELVFNCSKCAFCVIDDICLVKEFANNYRSQVDLSNFGSMGSL